MVLLFILLLRVAVRVELCNWDWEADEENVRDMIVPM